MSAPKLENRGKGYERLCRETIQTIKDADALAIWVLLRSKSNSWYVRKKWIKSELGIGETRYAKAVRRLKELGLWKVEKIRLNDGSFFGSKINIFSKLPELGGKEVANRGMGNLEARPPESPNSMASYKIKNSKEESLYQKPAELGNHGDLNFIDKFGFAYPESLRKIADEERVLKIFLHEGIHESAVARKIIAEWSAMALRGFQSDDPLSALVWACSNTLVASQEGERNLPDWE